MKCFILIESIKTKCKDPSIPIRETSRLEWT